MASVIDTYVKYGGVVPKIGEVYNIAEICGQGEVTDLCLPCISDGGSILIDTDGIITLFTNTNTSTAFYYFSDKYPANIVLSGANISSISWVKLNSAGYHDISNISSNPATVGYQYGSHISLDKTNIVLVGRIKFKKYLKIMLIGGTTNSSEKGYSIIAKYQSV